MSSLSPSRRRLIFSAAASMLALPAGRLFAQSTPVPVADMHSHFGMLSRSIATTPLVEEMRANRMVLVSWSLASDIRWIKQTDSGVAQVATPGAGAISSFFLGAFDRMRANITQAGARVVLTRADVDQCLAGDAGVVLTAEGADFLEGKIEALAPAYDKGLRHLQLVHYIKNEVGDYQTKEPVYNGLSPLGKDLVAACNEQGILIDLAHSPGASVDQALAISKAPMIWSHGWVDAAEGSPQDRLGYMQRRLSLDHAKKIAAKGGVVGLFALGLNRPAPASELGRGGWTVGRQDTRGYAREIASLVDRIGADHVGIGTDIEGVGSDWAVKDYAHLRQVVDHLVEMKLPADVVERVAYRNYARVLREALKT